MPKINPLPRAAMVKERERTAALLLAQGKTNRAVAQKLGVTEKTIWNYRQKPAVQKIIRDTQEEFAELSGSMAVTVVPEAIAVLQEILNDPDSRAADRIQAARTLMSGSAAFQERKLLERQISDLENQLTPLTNVTDATVIEVEDDE